MTADIERLGAYVDGELEDLEARKLEGAMAGAPELCEAVRSLRATNAIARAAFNAPLHSPVPERLLAAIDAGFADRSPTMGAVVSAPTWRWRAAVALAASLAMLAIGIGGGYVAAEFRIDREIARLEAAREVDREVIARAVNQVLEKQISGTAVDWQNPDSGSQGTVTPVRTYRSESGKWCREYTLIIVLSDGRSETRQAIACREGDGAWKTRAEFFEES